MPTVGDPQRYRGVKNEPLEYKLVYGALKQTEFAESMGHWHVQGLYVISPSGKLLAGRNTVGDVRAAIQELDKGLDRYAKMPRHERLLPTTPDPARDRVPSEHDGLRPPADGLILRMVSRGLPCDGLTMEDTRHPFFYKLDRVWYTRDEARAFVPSVLKIGAKEPVKRSVFRRLVQLHLGVFVQPNLYWQPEDVQEATLTSEIAGIKDDAVELRFTGRVRLESSSNRRQFDADLLGKATFKLKAQAFTAFELLAVGPFTLGSGEKAVDGAPRTSPMGVVFTLNGKNVNDQLVPSFYHLYKWASGE